jgi:hypothetical protein
MNTKSSMKEKNIPKRISLQRWGMPGEERVRRSCGVFSSLFGEYLSQIQYSKKRS